MSSLVFLLLSLFAIAMGSEKIVRYESPFSVCGGEPSGVGICLMLDLQKTSEMINLPLDTTVHFTRFPIGSRSVALSLRRFSSQEDLSDIKDTVLLRGTAYEDELALNTAINTKGSYETSELSESLAFIGLSRHGSNGFFRLANSTFFLSTPWQSFNDSRPEHDEYVSKLNKLAKTYLKQTELPTLASILYDTAHLTVPMELPLSDYVIPPSAASEFDSSSSSSKNIKSSKNIRRTYRVATEADYQMYQIKGYNFDAVVSYYNILAASTSTIFAQNFGSDLVTSYLGVWTVQDPYPYTALGALEYMQRTWDPNNPSRSMASLVSAKNLGGGVAYFQTLCTNQWAYAVSGNMVGYFPTPVRNYDPNNWDIYVFAHEIAHVWGGSHTHELNPPADYCGLSPGCGPTAGTILSYCHLCSNGIANIALSFHQQSRNQITSFIAPRAC